MLKPIIQVSAGIIRNEFNQLYLTLRLEGQDFAQSLEFPGGKQHPNETPEQTLLRELEEELGIYAFDPVLFETFKFEYPTKIIHFYFYLVEQWVGTPVGREGQQGLWVAQNELNASKFPPANHKLIQRLLTEAGAICQ